MAATRIAATVAAAALIALAALSPAVPQGNGHRPPAPPADNGCAVYVSIPNPCDPDSNN